MKGMTVHKLTSGALAILGGTVALVLVSMFFFMHTVHAADAKDFDPGHIIDDAIFYNSNSMSAAEVQTFLNAKNPTCDTNGTKPASDWSRPDITHATLASYIRNGTNGYSKDTAFHAPPYVCTKDYKQDIPQMEAASGLCGAISAKSGRTAAQIIKEVADACGINPQVLLVLLQKEQSLVTDTWPLNRQFQKATGFDCPDTAPCDPAFAGFFYQVYYAARQFKIYKAYPNNYNYVAGRNNNIYWNPDLSRCGSSTVYIQNQATAALYVYTPYQPNKAALNNLYGTGDSCSSYGNRNFWRLFTDWFSSSTASYQKLDNGTRWMELKKDTYKINWSLNETSEASLTAGTHLYFVDKIYVNNQWLLRTEWGKANNKLEGIPLADIQDISISAITPKWMSSHTAADKVDPLQNKVSASIEKMTLVKVVDIVTVNGDSFYRTEYEHNKNRMNFIAADKLEDYKFYDLDNGSRLFQTARDTSRIDLLTGETIESIPAGSYMHFNKKVIFNNELYLQASNENTTSYAVKFTDLKEYNGRMAYVKMDKPRTMKMAIDEHKKILPNEVVYGEKLLAGREIRFNQKAYINGVWYLRTEYDTSQGNMYGISIDVLAEL